MNKGYPKGLERALDSLEPMRGTDYHAPAVRQVVSAFYDGGVKRAKAKARIIRDTYDTGVGVSL